MEGYVVKYSFYMRFNLCFTSMPNAATADSPQPIFKKNTPLATYKLNGPETPFGFFGSRFF